MSAIPVFLDANTLMPISLADLLLRLAEEGLIEPFWSQHVLDGALRAVLRHRTDLDSAKVSSRFDAMRGAFPSAMIATDGLNPDDYESPDSEDQWVIAAAIRSPAKTIVTRNLVHFPEPTLRRHLMTVQTADQLLLTILGKSQASVIKVFYEMRRDMGNPPLSVEEMLGNLIDAGVPQFVEAMRRFTALDGPKPE
ncbi:MAG: PIN domain-containing protein [Propionibacteriaceae bacterium]|nr:PIN domain-containing protein [Propionibacteriaceae bacterium]